MLLVHPVNEVVRFLPALIGVFLIGNSLAGDRWWHLAAVAIPVALGLLRYATTSYRIADGQLELRRGLINRTHLTARLDRIRTVELAASPIHRVLGLGKVEIGTAGAGPGSNDRIRLDSLALPQARAMRDALLHRARPGRDAAPPVTAEPQGPSPTPEAAAAAGDETLLRLNPRWVRYAPLTTAGLVVGAAVIGAMSQFAWPLIDRLLDRSPLADGSVPIGVIVAGALLVLIVAVSVLSLIGYLLNYWGFVLSRDVVGRSLHVRRGLLTSRETSIEIARVRGVEWHEPLGLRLAGAARLGAIVTGMSRREAGVAVVVPPAPREVADRIGQAILGDRERAAAPLTGPLAAPPSAPPAGPPTGSLPGPLAIPLTEHGPRATRRRFQRALTVAVAMVAGWTAAVLVWGWSGYLLLAGLAVLAAAAALARDRARRLGHAVTPEYLVARAHSLRGRRIVLSREGIIGWNMRQTFFQRRAGLVTLTATTAAGTQGYRVHDVPEDMAVAVVDAATPGMAAPFLAPASGSAERRVRG